MGCLSKQEQIDRVLNHVDRYKNIYNEWFEYYKPQGVSLSSINLGQNTGFEGVIELEAIQQSFYNVAKTSYISFGKNYYTAAAGYTDSNGSSLFNTGRQTSIELHPEFFKLKVRSLSAMWIDSEGVSEWRVPINLSAGSVTAPALQITQSGLGDSFRVNDETGDTTPFVITSAGQIGIGTESPQNELHVNGRIRIDGNNTGLVLFESDASANNRMWLNAVENGEVYWQAINDSGGGGENIFKMVRSDNNVQSFQGVNGGNGWFTINNTDKRVGINTLNPQEALTVVGNISATGKIVGGNMSGTSLSSIDLTVQTGDLTISNGGINVKEAIKSKVNNGAVLIGGDETGVSGSPTGEGFRITYDSNDLLRFIKTDNNSTTPDGGIDFANLGSGGTTNSSMRITGAGRVGIGTTNPNCIFEIKQNSTLTQGVALLLSQTNVAGTDRGPKISFDHSTVTATSNWNIGIKDGTTDFEFYFGGSTTSAGAAVCTIDQNGSMTITGTYSPSDIRIKENIQLADLDRCYNTIKSLPLKRFTFKENITNYDRSKLGWIAQDVQSIFPKNVKQETRTYGEETITDLRTLNTDQIYASLYGAVQKLITVVENLEERVKKLENS